MLEDLTKFCQVHVINVKFIKSLKIALHTIWKLLVDQLDNFIIFEFLCCSTVQREKCKIIINMIPKYLPMVIKL